MRRLAVEMAALVVGAGCSRSPSTPLGATTASVASAAPALEAGVATTSAVTSPPPGPVDPPMVFVKGGRFHQGSAGATGDDFGWQHWEVVPSFHIDATEVTVGAYRRCLEAGACKYDPLSESGGEFFTRQKLGIEKGSTVRSPRCNLEREKDEFVNDPMNCVTWHEATAYCAWRGAELPTEAMWEYAAGGRRDWDWPWDPRTDSHSGDTHYIARGGYCAEHASGNDALPGRAKYNHDTTCPVGSLPGGNTPDGIKDMEGNVSEWTQSVYCRLHGKECTEERVLKGVSYDGGAWVGIRQRSRAPAALWSSQIGFRCARVAKEGGRDGGKK